MTKKKSKQKRPEAYRGGFIPPSSFTDSIGRALKTQSINYAKGYVRSKGASLQTAEAVGKFLESPSGVTAGNVVVGMIPSGNGGGSINPTNGESAYAETNTERRRFSGDGLQTGKVYKTKFETGVRTSKSIQQAARLNGTTKTKILDTMSTGYYEVGSDRLGLSSQAGFNQKRVLSFRDIGVRSIDLFNLYGLSNWRNPERFVQRSYGLARYLETKLRIMNVGQYFRSKVKISLYAPTSTHSTTQQAMSAVFPTITEFDTNTQGDSIPLLKAFSALQVTGQNFSGLCETNTPITSAPDFSRQYTFAKSFSKILAPGDVWDYKMLTHLGSGIRLDVVRDNNFSDSQTLEEYLVVIEYHGMPCEGTLQENDNISYIGTSPSYMQFEFSKSVDLVVDANNSGTTNALTGGYTSTRYMVKTFTDHVEAQIGKAFNVDASGIGPKGSVAEMYIPVMSDKSVDYAGEKSEQN